MKSWILSLCILLIGCQNVIVPDEYKYVEIKTSTFELASWQKINNSSAPFKIYIEGDGYAFRSNGMVSSDPTPHSPMLRQIAFADSHENVVYLARPCQFIKTKACRPIYWSTARFSDKTVDSTYEAIKQISKDQPLTLVGFSGGAQIAGLIAVKHPDINIQKLVTVAGNLDVGNWVKYHHIPPLDLSDDLSHYQEEYSKFNQKHYVGLKDENIIPSLTETFVMDSRKIIYVNEASHNRGWESAFASIRRE